MMAHRHTKPEGNTERPISKPNQKKWSHLCQILDKTKLGNHEVGVDGGLQVDNRNYRKHSGAGREMA